MSKIDLLRGRIDKIDDKILDLLNRRAKMAIQIGREKSRKNRSNHFHVPHREREILERLQSGNPGPFPNAAV
ncbi:MAG: chorismate mutase, partial [Nitrospinaceae bacterium]